MDLRTEDAPLHRHLKECGEHGLSSVSLCYIKTRTQRHQDDMTALPTTFPTSAVTITQRELKSRLFARTFMPKENNRARGNNRPSTVRRSQRSQRASSWRPTPPPRSNEMSEARRGSQGDRQYMFIDQDASRSTNNEAIRVHVMRESHRARRQLRGLMQNTETHGQMTIFPSAPPSPRPPRPSTTTKTERTERVVPKEEHSSAEQSPRLENAEGRISQTAIMDNRELKRLAQTRLTAVLTTTSAAISAASAGFRFLEGLPANIIELCEDDNGALHALLALIASVQTSVSTLQSAEYESSALEILRSRLAESSRADHSDETIVTVLLLSRLERSRMNEETAGFHEAALQRMIRDRGGLDALATSNEALGKLLQSYRIGQEEGS